MSGTLRCGSQESSDIAELRASYWLGERGQKGRAEQVSNCFDLMFLICIHLKLSLSEIYAMLLFGESAASILN